MIDDLFRETEHKMERSLVALRKDLSRIRTGRASLALLEGITVDAYGTLTPLNQLATLAAPESRLLTIQPWDKSQIGPIEKSIQRSDLGLTPMNDGKLIRVPVPALTQERRQEMVKHLHKVLEEHRTAVRNIRRDGNDAIKKAMKDKKITEDDEKRSLEEIQKLTDDEIRKMEEMSKAKEKEVLEIK